MLKLKLPHKLTISHSGVFILLTLALTALFFTDLIWGSIRIPFNEIIRTFAGGKSNPVNTEILLNFRLPKAFTAILTGSALSVAGLMMQTLFRNPLADPYVMGVSSGASLGVALVTMSAGLFPFIAVGNSSVMILSAIIGASVILLLVLSVSFKIQNTASLLIVGIMFGTIASSIVSVLQYFGNPDAIKLFIMWNLGSLSGITWGQLIYLFPIVVSGLILAFYLQKKMDAILLGENYASGLGISVRQTRFLIIVSTGILTGAMTAFTGPIAFIGIAVPHLARSLFRTSKHQTLILASILIGSVLILLCDIVSQIPTYTLPINTITSLFGAPVIIWIILRRK
ncbi:MAG: iron ABC transporter permease [Paludibacteraceae bacterium]